MMNSSQSTAQTRAAFEPVARELDGSMTDQIKLIQLIEKHAPEKLANMGDEDRNIVIHFVESDGNGRPKDKLKWEDWQRKRYEETKAARDEDPSVIAAWKASGLADEDDDTPEK